MPRSPRPRLTEKNLGRAWAGLQNLCPALPEPLQPGVRLAMVMLDEARAKMRREKIFKLGAKAKRLPKIICYDGKALGSIEACTFYDGYASTHPDFTNPYRRR